MRPVGFFDSGVGGLSVLKEAIKNMPDEKYIYYSDNENAPYGIKTKKEIRSLTEKAVKFLINKNVKAIVIACNTASSASVKYLRRKYEIPIIAMEPAVKPALKKVDNGKILVLATKFTLNNKKFDELIKRLNLENKIIKKDATELVSLIENLEENKQNIIKKLKKYKEKLKGEKVDVIVLGCTHFVFIKKEIENIFKNTPIIDGNKGTIKHLMKLINVENDGLEVEIHSDKSKEKIEQFLN